jgi:hypothetical protein
VRRLLMLLTAGLLAVSLAAPAAVSAGGSTYQVPKPNRHDDTAAIQKGLDWCAAHGPGCTVQLQAGKYKTSQLVEYNFRGTFKGAGQHRTTIEALPDLKVTEPDPQVDGGCLPNITDCRWPTLITFFNGSIEVSDLALDFPYTNGRATLPWTIGETEVRGLGTALDFGGDRPIKASVERVSVTGRLDTPETSLWGTGFNVVYGIALDGWIPSDPYLADGDQTYTTVSGSFVVRDSSIRTTYTGVEVYGQVKSAQVTIDGNRIDDVSTGMELGAAASNFDISHNAVFADNPTPVELDHIGLFVRSNGSTGLSNRLTQFSIHDNSFVVSDTCGCLMVGMWLFDATGEDHWFKASVTHNSISLPTAYLLPDEGKMGIDANNTTGTLISDNTITGTSTGTYEAIGLWGNTEEWAASTGNVVSGNNVKGLSTDPSIGLAQIYLDPYTTDNRVVCARHSDSVLDQGTGNTIVGCDASTATLKATAGKAAITGHHALKQKMLNRSLKEGPLGARLP